MIRRNHPRPRSRAGLVLVTVLGAIPAAGAHDFWIEPSNYRPAADEVVRVGLRVGEHFRGEPVQRNPERIEKFVAIESSGRARSVPGVAGADPAGMTRFEHAGCAVLVYQSKHASIELPADKFEAYLREEGLERIIERRAREGTSTTPGREVYSRCAKALLRVGDAGGEGWRRIVGLPAELVPETDPSQCTVESGLALRLLFRDKPCPDTPVVALHADRPEPPIRACTDGDGRVRLKLDRGGVWLVKAVIMTPAPPNASADWESFWTSLTLEASPAAAAPATQPRAPDARE